MPAGDVLSSYQTRGTWSSPFQMSKTDLRARPMFHRTRDSIEAHLTIVFTALAVSREVQALTGRAIRNVVRQLRPLRSATIAINGATQTFPPAVPTEKQAVLNAIHDRGSCGGSSSTRENAQLNSIVFSLEEVDIRELPSCLIALERT
jgi:hypothetical protein